MLNPKTHSNTYPDSYYVATANAHAAYPQLRGNQHTQVCVVGGGFSGVNTALELAERGFEVVLLEARRVGWGASGRNGGQLIRGIGDNPAQFTKTIGKRGVSLIETMGFEAVAIVRERIARYGIDCDLSLGYCDLANTPAHMRAFVEELAHLKQLGYPFEVRLIPKSELATMVASKRYEGALFDPGSGHLHPLNLVLGEAQAAQSLGVQLFEHSPVEHIEPQPKGGYCLRTPGGTVSAEHLVLCTNAYGQDLHPTLGGKVLPAGSYIVATEPMPDAECERLMPGRYAVCDQRVGLDYYRITHDNRLLFGGICSYSGRDPADIRAALRPNIKRVFPELDGITLDYAWGGMIGIGANRMPQIGRLPDGIYYAQAYSGHGVNATHMAARVIAEAINAETRRIEVFQKIPHITFPGGPRWRSPLLALGMTYYRVREKLGLQ